MPQQPVFSFLGVSVLERVATVTMNRPPVNAVSQPMYTQIRDLFGDFDNLLPDVSVVILTSASALLRWQRSRRVRQPEPQYLAWPDAAGQRCLHSDL